MKKYFDKIDPLKSFNGNIATCITLNKVDCFYLHKKIKEEFEGVYELLTWNNGLAFNCDCYSHQELYNNLFKLKFDGVQLGQEG